MKSVATNRLSALLMLDTLKRMLGELHVWSVWYCRTRPNPTAKLAWRARSEIWK
jgi:hypothetical protein